MKKKEKKFGRINRGEKNKKKSPNKKKFENGVRTGEKKVNKRYKAKKKFNKKYTKIH